MKKNEEFKKLALVCDFWDTDNLKTAEIIISRLTHGIIFVSPELELDTFFYNSPKGRTIITWDNSRNIIHLCESSIKGDSSYVIYELKDFIKKYPQILYPGNYEIARKDIGPRYYQINLIAWDGYKCCPCFGYDGFDTYSPDELDFLNINNKNSILKKYDIGEVTITYPDSSMEVKVNQDGSILISPKKIIYPKTLDECFSIVLNYEKQELIRTNFSGTYKKSLEGLYELLVARKAYWEIYRKLNNISEDVILGRDKYLCSLELNTSPLRNILIFPEDECMREFYKNFKDLIDKVRDLFTYLEDNL